jgi:hypothetical protein
MAQMDKVFLLLRAFLRQNLDHGLYVQDVFGIGYGRAFIVGIADMIVDCPSWALELINWFL